MKVRVTFTVDVDDNFRRALRSYYGEKGLASRDDVRTWYEQNASSSDADMRQQYDDEREVKGGSGYETMLLL